MNVGMVDQLRSDGQTLTKMLLTISLTIVLVIKVVKLNKNSSVKTRSLR